MEFLFAGDSHGFNNLNTNTISNGSYNVSQPSDNLQDIYAKLLYFKQNGIVIRNLVLELDTQLYANYRLSQNNNEIIINYLDYDLYKDMFDVSYIEYHILRFPLASQKNRNFILKASIKKIVELIKRGFSKPDNIFNTKNLNDYNTDHNNKESLKRIVYHYAKGSLDDENMLYLFKITEFTKNNNIRLIGIYYPVSKYYDTQLKNSQYYKQVKETDSVTNRSFNTILNYYNTFFDNSEYFFDPDHLNTAGSLLFSKMLRNDLELIKVNSGADN